MSAFGPEWTYAASWVAASGRWSFEGTDATYEGPLGQQTTTIPLGGALSDLSLGSGIVAVDIDLDDPAQGGGGIGFGRDAAGGHYLVGLSGQSASYFLDEWTGQGYQNIAYLGDKTNLSSGVTTLSLLVLGQNAWVTVGDVMVLGTQLPRPLPGRQVTLSAWGPGPVRFHELRVASQTPELFVAMQFGEPYDALYRDVIVPVGSELGYDVMRADDVYGPGVILQDIITGLVRASVIIAEITPVNANVFYELGYAHALDKPTILLAERGTALPFDVSGFRVVFYDDTIGGKATVEEQLRRHLEAVRLAAQ